MRAFVQPSKWNADTRPVFSASSLFLARLSAVVRVQPHRFPHCARRARSGSNPELAAAWGYANSYLSFNGQAAEDRTRLPTCAD